LKKRGFPKQTQKTKKKKEKKTGRLIMGSERGNGNKGGKNLFIGHQNQGSHASEVEKKERGEGSSCHKAKPLKNNCPEGFTEKT